jgi:hypothetical protein
MIFRFVILCVVSTSLFCCGCRSVGLSTNEKQTIADFVQKQTGESVVSLHQRADGDVQVETDITGRGFSRSHYWLLKRAPDGWKLTELGTLTL